MLSKPAILVLMGGYWPGHEATGPNQSLRQLCMSLHNEFRFHIVARDRPIGASIPLAPSGCWMDHGFAQVRYCKVTACGASGLLEILRRTPHDILALNGFFDREFTIPAVLFKRLGLIPRKPTVLSTRGEVAKGALTLKGPRKAVYLTVARHARLIRGIWLHGTCQSEAQDIKLRFPWSKGTLIAPNVRGLVGVSAVHRARRGSNDRCRLVFVGRIARVKNLAFALDVLRAVCVPVDFDIYGPISEPDYWSECARIIQQLPQNVRVIHKGAISNADVPAEIWSADLFFLPTLGENFGHAIFEALSCGVPVLTSDQTPWQDLEAKQAGWSLPLANHGAFAAAIELLAAMKPEQREVLRRGARTLAESSAEVDAVEANRRLFATVLGERTIELSK
jgi:glycosyltransferase involved in cell wall biosynthesis